MQHPILDQQFDHRCTEVNGRIYVITNTLTGEEYIGATQFTIKRRWSKHKRRARELRSPLHRAMRQHGLSAFHIQHIASCLDITQLHLLESDIIKDRKPAYNVHIFSENVWS